MYAALLVHIVVIVCVLAIALAGMTRDPEYWDWIKKYILVLPALSFVWLLAAHQKPWEPLRTFEVVPTKVYDATGSFVQVIWFNDQYGISGVRYCVTLFGSVIPDDCKVRVEENKRGPYFGLYYESLLNPPKYTIVKK